MPISGLVITVTAAADAGRLVHDLQTREPRLEFGAAQSNRLPCVLETGDARESEAVHAWLLEQPGVVAVDVTFVSFEEGPTEATDGCDA